jgi:hypothetical protein
MKELQSVPRLIDNTKLKVAGFYFGIPINSAMTTIGTINAWYRRASTGTFLQQISHVHGFPYGCHARQSRQL